VDYGDRIPGLLFYTKQTIRNIDAMFAK